MNWRDLSFTSYRRILAVADLADGLEHEQACWLFVDMDEFDDYFIEAVDVVDERGRLLYQAYFGGIGGMLVYRAGTEELVATAAQHSIDRCEDQDLWAALGRAYATASPPIQETISFGPVGRTQKSGTR